MTFCALSSAKGMDIKMETCEKKRNDNLISMIWQLDFFMVSGYFLALVFSLLAVLWQCRVQGGEHHYLAVAVFLLYLAWYAMQLLHWEEMTNDDISCFLDFSVISRKKAAAFGFPIAAAKGNILWIPYRRKVLQHYKNKSLYHFGKKRYIIVKTATIRSYGG